MSERTNSNPSFTDVSIYNITMCVRLLHAFKGKSKESDKIKIVWKKADSWRGERIDLPCGQCIECRLEKARQWSVRCMHEASLYENNSFVTLTYNNNSMPSDGSLRLEDFQKFMKRLRKEREEKVRFYHCGEYGELNGRPHYHALLFNVGFDDKKFFSEKNGNRLYTSDSLSRLWPMGFSTVGEVTFESAGYVARYALKKITGDRAQEHYKGRKPEYTTMSRRPGIAKGWYEKFKTDVYPRDRVVVRGVVTRPPRFYDNLLGGEDRAELQRLKIEREKNNKYFVEDTLSDGRVVRESDSSDRRLQVKEIVKEAQISLLKRSL